MKVLPRFLHLGRGDKHSTTPSRPDTHGDMVAVQKLLERTQIILQGCVEDLIQLERSTNHVSLSAVSSLKRRVSATRLLIGFVSAVSTVLKHCHSEELIGTRPPSFKRRKESEHRLQWYTKQEVDHLLAACKDPFEREDLH